MSEEFCLLHGDVMRYDHRSGFYVCPVCDRCESARRKAVTEYVFPPIPVRDFDWVAYEPGSDEDGPFGRGRTRQQAIDDLVDQISEE